MSEGDGDDIQCILALNKPLLVRLLAGRGVSIDYLTLSWACAWLRPCVQPIGTSFLTLLLSANGCESYQMVGPGVGI